MSQNHRNQTTPEFLNRIDDTIFFNSLDQEDLKKIVKLELRKLLDRVGTMGLNVTITDAATDFLVQESWDSNYGARPLKRAIQTHVEDILSEEILMNENIESETLIVDYDDTVEDLVVKKSGKMIEEK